MANVTADMILSFQADEVTGTVQERRVWKNPSPDDDFGEQMISIDLSDADEVTINIGVGTESYTGSVILPVDSTPKTVYMNSVYQNNRVFTVRPDGVQCGNGEQTQGSGWQTNNNVVKPISIYSRKIIGGGYRIEMPLRISCGRRCAA